MAILDGFIKARRYRLLDSGDYHLESAWTSANTTYMKDNSTTVQSKIESIDGNIVTINSTLQPLTQSITEIKLVTSLPSDAASHPTTLYLIIDK